MTDEKLTKLFHDLKNDLASMTALLNLHRLYKEDISTDEILNRITVRQMVISTAYEQLYRENNYPMINLKKFIDELISKESSFFINYSSNVQLDKQISDRDLPIKKAASIGQILIELLFNSYMHAFKGSRSEKIIKFSIEENETGTLMLKYSDSGCGLPEEVDSARPRSLGLQLITSISRQLGGNIQFNRDSNGFNAELLIKI